MQKSPILFQFAKSDFFVLLKMDMYFIELKLIKLQ